MLLAMCTASMPGRKAYSGEEWHRAVILAAEKQKLQEALLSGAEGTWSLAAVTLRVKLPIHSPPAIHAHWGPRYSPLPLLVTQEPPGMLMLYPLPYSMNKKLCSELGLAGSLTAIIRKDSEFGWGFVVCLVVGLQQWASSCAPSIIIYEHSTETRSCQEVIESNAHWLHCLAVWQSSSPIASRTGYCPY